MKLYLDTDIIYGFFKEVVKSWKEHRKIVLPSLIEFLKLKEKELTFFVSELVYFEIIKRIKFDYELSEKEIEILIRQFERTLNIRTVPKSSWFNEMIFEDIFELIKKETFKMGLADILHAYIANQNKLTFFTGDNEALNEDAEKICEGVINYPQLRKRLQ